MKAKIPKRDLFDRIHYEIVNSSVADVVYAKAAKELQEIGMTDTRIFALLSDLYEAAKSDKGRV